MKPRATRFIFAGYEVDDAMCRIEFSYRIEFSNRELLRFTETLVLPTASRHLAPEVLAKFLEPLHLMLGISYYKLYCPPEVVVPFALSREQVAFWNTVYRKGLGEFLYRNKLSTKRIASFPVTEGASPMSVSSNNAIPHHPQQKRALLGIGGGKDSLVAAELLRTLPVTPAPLSVTSFLVETQQPDPVAHTVMDAIGNPTLAITRTLDPQLFQPHEGAYNGHIPVSAVFAFVGLLAAALYDYQYVIVGNEYSSNVGNVKHRREWINHQWSKSAEFEMLFQTYTRSFITQDIQYFSLLRQFYEIRIVELFAQHTQYHHQFTSCNTNFRVVKDRPASLWCGTCPKCAFAFLLLAAFLPRADVIAIFHKNLFADAALVPLFTDVLGFGAMKPFDCVGTFEEAQAALFLASQRGREFHGASDEIVLRTFLPQIHQPEQCVSQVFKTVPAPTLPTPFRFAGIKNVCVLGYGREGKVTEQYLKQEYPQLSVGLLDQQRDPDYLEKQETYDVAIKTPGIPKHFVRIPYTTATNLFFSCNTNFTIGVTGSKGKSTTASLIADMLRAGGKKVRLLGNIGSPMLEVFLATPLDRDEIVVLELSSYMLEDIEYSPDIAVLLNLFPEHMNYHGSVEAYYAAKQNIFRFQKSGDIAIREPFDVDIPVDASRIPLLGEHNRKNIQAAVTIARLMQIPDTAIATAITQFKPLPHRLERVGTVNGITFYDDAISTTPESTIAAITALENVGTIFLGGQDRGYDFRELDKTLRTYNITNIVLFPESGQCILKSRRGRTVLETRSMKEAVDFAIAHTPQHSICLLSTASPSYSLWKNFEEKGDEFKQLIHHYEQGQR